MSSKKTDGNPVIWSESDIDLKKPQRDYALLNVGYGATVIAERIIGIIPMNSAPLKRLKEEAKEDRRLIDATHGRRTRSVIVMDSNHVVLSAIQAETISQRFIALKESGGYVKSAVTDSDAAASDE